MTETPDIRDLDDEALLALAMRSGDEHERERAVTLLLGRYQRRVYLWCYRVVRDHERALELAQDVLVSAWRNLASFGGRARFGSWLFAVARNRCLSELRRPVPIIDTAIDLEALRDERSGPEAQLLARLDEEALLDLIREELDATEQEALWLRCVEGMAVESITEVLDLREASGARGVLQRARRKLRSVIDRRGDLEMGAGT